MTNSIAEIKKLKLKMLELWTFAKEGHVPSSLSVLDIIYVLYEECIKSPQNPHLDSEFVLSKGHASLALYVVLQSFGFFTEEQLNDFCEFESKFGGHPDRTKAPGVSASTGSLGHGFPIAVGKCLARKIQGKQGRVYVLVGDGELNEGTNWESAMFASHHGLDNLIVVVDDNHSADKALSLGEIQSKFQAFGFDVLKIDGHDHQEIKGALNLKSKRPQAIICSTVKGKGFQLLENNPKWHHSVPDENELAQMIREVR